MAAETVTIEVGGRQFGVGPLRLGDLRKAAPFIDEANAYFKREEQKQAKALEDGVEAADPTFSDMTGLMHILCEVISIPLVKVDPTMTAEAIEDMVDFSFIGSLQTAFFALLTLSGLSRKGEATALSEPATEGAALPDSSSELSTSSSPPASKVAPSAE